MLAGANHPQSGGPEIPCCFVRARLLADRERNFAQTVDLELFARVAPARHWKAMHCGVHRNQRAEKLAR